ncbi:hypothetical protein N7539_006542 [Penicillium diatomitis]|uniref:Beta-xylosidase C-terminal Concanavalin A-like domain-containing protein n=1 Tax=Penicillium diatomitis TaxID=2819901 RepID=A0A9W9X3J7_9EURO|nr:uncharacterized protein N7539_006542 [Penicillium diatomitis]KAJ5483096.1 hypothetical protein N7539_006542 [Penicillium diatomitis]
MSGAVNPIIPGFAPDPSVVKVGEWFYLVNSTFHLFPGLPIYASQDLVSWKHIANAIHRQSQLSLGQSQAIIYPEGDNKHVIGSGGLYAPTIRYHQGTFYVICTNVVRRPGEERDATENFIVSTQDVWNGEWSDPVYFDFEGIDPSLFFDDDGKIYMQGSGGIGPSTTINVFEIDLATGAKLSEEQVVWRGTGGIYPEGPHLYKRNNWYYLLTAEGGTHGGHTVVMARSQNIWGPYESCPSNPVLTARGTKEYIQYTGHCEIFQDGEGQWWGTCLGARLDDAGRTPMGRETFLMHVDWDNDWPIFEQVTSNPKGLTAASTAPCPTAKPGLDFLYIRDAAMSRYRLTGSDSVSLRASSVDFSHAEASPTFIGKRQRLLTGSSSVTLQGVQDSWASSKLRAGLALYKEEHRFIRIYYDSSAREVVLEVINAANKLARTQKDTLAQVPASVNFRIEYTESEYQWMYSVSAGPCEDWKLLGTADSMEMTDPDFTGPIIGAFAVGETEDVEVQFERLSID